MKNLLYIVFFLCLSTIVFAQTNYVIVFDAGSSGTRAYFFKSITQNNQSLNVTNIKLSGADKIEPGISSFQNNIQDIHQYLSPLLDSLNQELKEGSINPVSVDTYFLATAGMRLVDKKKQESIYAAVKKAIADAGLSIKEASTIPGWQEAIFDWTSLNFLMKSINNQTLVTQTYGVIDVGGASAQIAFEVGENEVDSSPYVHAITLGKKTYYIYALSSLGLGADQVLNKLSILEEPSCYPAGYEKSPQIQGSWSTKQCLASITEVVQELNVPKLAIVNQMPFIGISTFGYVANSDVLDIEDQLSIESLSDAINARCTMPWRQLDQLSTSPYASEICYKTSLLLVLLEQYGFNANTKMLALSQLGNNPITWAYGAAIYYAYNNAYHQWLESQLQQS